MAKKTDLTTKRTEDLQKEIVDMREKLRAFRFGSAGSRSRNTREGRNLRKGIARIMTEISARRVANSKKTA